MLIQIFMGLMFLYNSFYFKSSLGGQTIPSFFKWDISFERHLKNIKIYPNNYIGLNLVEIREIIHISLSFFPPIIKVQEIVHKKYYFHLIKPRCSKKILFLNIIICIRLCNINASFMLYLYIMYFSSSTYFPPT